MKERERGEKETRERGGGDKEKREREEKEKRKMDKKTRRGHGIGCEQGSREGGIVQFS